MKRPITTAIKLNPTFVKTFNPLCKYWPFSNSNTVSALKAENVLRPPSSPVTMNNLDLWVMDENGSNPIMNPIARPAMTFTSRVPKGIAGIKVVAPLSSRYRSVHPTNPPRPTTSISPTIPPTQTMPQEQHPSCRSHQHVRFGHWVTDQGELHSLNLILAFQKHPRNIST